MGSQSPLATVSIRGSKLRHASFITIEYSSPTTLRYEIDAAGILIEFPLSGQASRRDGQEWKPIPRGSGIVVGPEKPHQETAQASYRCLVLRLERAALENRLCVLLQRPIRQPLCFEATLDLGADGQSLWHFLTWMSGELTQAGSILQRNASIAQTAEVLLLDALLLAHQSNYSSALAARETVAIPRHLRAVIAAIQATPERAWTLTAMATHAGVSVRTLCEVFRHFRGSTPMEFVRSVRLRRAREDLKQFGPRASIGIIAKRWGFGHAGRFAAAYTRTFGETPSETLRGNRPQERDDPPSRFHGLPCAAVVEALLSAGD
jgi:AraC-like DNA-binding protein